MSLGQEARLRLPTGAYKIKLIKEEFFDSPSYIKRDITDSFLISLNCRFSVNKGGVVCACIA